MTGLVGTVRALEVTHGYRNGWHPHIHELWLLDGSVSEDEAIPVLEEELYRLWSAACVRSGLPKPPKMSRFRCAEWGERGKVCGEVGT